MKSRVLRLCFILYVLFQVNNVFAWGGMPMPQLHVDGRYLKDSQGNIVNLHGFAQTNSPWFNEQGKYWSNYNVTGCLKYNKGIIDKVMAAGFQANFLRLHMDPYWSNTPGASVTGENDISAFNFTRFKTYLNSVFIPLAEYAISKGLYVVMRPPGVCPERIAVGDAYNQYLIKVWGYVAQQPKLRNNPHIMFELANEPVDILGTDGTYGAGKQGHFDNLKTYFQAVVDTVRASADNILWVPGLGYQSLYQGFAANPIEGKNIGYAVHVYPGWFNSGNGYANFQKGWNNQVKPVADFAPIIVTEMDWAPAKYNSSWGKDITGVAGGVGFGANFKKISDDAGNVSWLVFTSPDLLAKFNGIPLVPGGDSTFLNDPEACPWPTHQWYQDYKQKNYPRPDFGYKSTSDNNDGTFANPVISGDFPDPITVKLDDAYYMVSTSSSTSPNTTILKSKDLINWEYSNIPLDSLPLNDKKLVNTTDIHAGTMVQTTTGEWWALASYNKGSYGKFPQLLPVKWVGNTPVVDTTVIDTTKFKNPNVDRDYAASSLVTNDNFRNYKLGLQWSWNNNPDNSKWSLIDRAGFMRLKTVSVVDNLNKAQNILTQRILAYRSDLEHSYGTIRLGIKGMNEGDVAGLSVFQNKYGYIGIKMINGEKKFVTFIDNITQIGPAVTDTVIYLRAIANYKTSKAGFYYSFNDTTFTKLGDDMTMENDLSAPAGNKFGIFNFATAGTGGYVDVDWFSTESNYAESKFYDNNFVGYTKNTLTLSEIKIDAGNNLTLLTSSSAILGLKAIYADGHTEVINSVSKYENDNPDVVSVTNGKIISKKDGEANIVITYTGPLDEVKQLTLHVTSTTFPLVNKLFNPSISSNGTFNELTKTLRTGTNGFGGWTYSNGVNLSEYKYLVVKLASPTISGASLKLFDENNYTAGAASYDFGSSTQINVDLTNMARKGTTIKVDPSHLYIIGFLSKGGINIVFSDVYLTNNTDFSKPTALEDVIDAHGSENEIVDVYSIMGVKIQSQIKRSEMRKDLPTGLYIVGRKKIVVVNNH